MHKFNCKVVETTEKKEVKWWQESSIETTIQIRNKTRMRSIIVSLTLRDYQKIQSAKALK